MVDNEFFAEPREQSEIKTRLVAKYFWAWANVVIPSVKRHGNRIAYIDLFSGPGRYEDGTPSTPLLVLQKAIENADMRKMLVAVFNDRSSENSRKLRTAIDELPGVETLTHKPKVFNREVGAELAEIFSTVEFVPTFFFVDPWGYKGLSLNLIKSVLRSWGCDCIFFFNYSRVNMGLNNSAVREHMNALFGKNQADLLRSTLSNLGPADRENTIIEELAQSLKSLGGRFVLPFTFKDEYAKRTKHHLIFVTKHFKGYEIMKEIMAKESSDNVQGVSSFEFSPASERYPMLFELSRPLDDLASMLLGCFAGETVTVDQIYLRHSTNRPYIKRNYKQALIGLERDGRVKTQPPAEKRPKIKGQISLADQVRVTFPRKEQ